ncbi:serine/arginine repetitive matrix protein 2 [Momordica charantia]|uniref:Serine/arginine repetitive matrix protein 2 n=1 Tax=Momordica charantia TaxID=3673 RepID=A0A6J1CRA9_MOMCH|nr:serine/arginine repetitive matrix protein 2 [Momordica charantia]
MNRNWREPLSAPRNAPLLSHHRRGHSFTAISRDSDENLDLFSKNRRSLSVAASDDSSDASVKLGRLSVGSVKLAKNGIDDLLSSTEGGKHDYDWLLTPPGTPLFPSSSESEVQSTVAAPRSSTLVRSSSTTKASRLSVSHSESNNSSRPARSSSVSRSSVSTPQYSNYSSNRSSSILNTSSASVSSYIRPSSPSTRNSSTTRPSTPSSRPTASRSSTPSRARPSPTSSSIDKPRQIQSSRPSTPSSRPQVPANLSSPAARSNSRPSTPTRRNSAPSLSSVVGAPSPTGRVLSINGRSSTSTSRPSSPSPRVRASPQPIVPPDFPLDTPPNLRTTLPDRPISAGRSRPTPAASVRGSPEPTSTVTMPRRSASPTVSRGRLTDTPGRGRVNTNGHLSDVSEPRRLSSSSDLGGRRPVKASTTTAESNGFGRSISKKSLDMAIRHMDIRNGPGSMRSGSGNTLFPHSIRSATSKTQSIASNNSEAIDTDFQTSSNSFMERGNHLHRSSEGGGENGRFSASLNHLDIYESSRYDAILLKEDLKNTNWLHSADDKTDLGSILDNGFEALPEPFGLL